MNRRLPAGILVIALAACVVADRPSAFVAPSDTPVPSLTNELGASEAPSASDAPSATQPPAAADLLLAYEVVDVRSGEAFTLGALAVEGPFGRVRSAAD